MSESSLSRRVWIVAGVVLFALAVVAVVLRDRGERAGSPAVSQPNATVVASASAPATAPAPATVPATTTSGRVALLDIIQASDDPLRVFELKPNLKGVPFKDAATSTNSRGFRYGEVVPDEGPNTITIVGIGDSLMFGWGVADGQDYLAMLERILQAKYPAKTWRAINLAVPSYNTVMEVETLVAQGLQFEPDLVILHLLPNDLVLPEYVRRIEAGGADAAPAAPDPAHPGRDPRLQHNTEVDAKSEAYADLVGWKPFVAALDRLRDASQGHGFPVIVFTTAEDETTTSMLRMAAERGFAHISLMPEIQQHLADKYKAEFSMEHLEAYLHSDLVFAPGDSHPSVLQHRMAADKLLRQLEADGVIARLMQ